MRYEIGDRIHATAGVCPGAFGVVYGVKNRYNDSSQDVLRVRYDSGRTDSIYAFMLEYADPDPLNID